MSTPNDPPLEDWLETHATEVHDGGILINDAVRKIVEAMRNGDPVDPQDIAEAKTQLQVLDSNRHQLAEDLEKLSTP